MNEPLVSICIPTYNRPEYLRRAVESCLKQTFASHEIIITDNSANPDNSNRYESRDMIREKFNDPRIRYFKNDGSIGTEKSMDRAISESRGKYIKFLMDDDLLKPRCLELMARAMEENPTAGIAMAPMDLIDEQDRRIFPKFYLFRTMQYRYRYQVGDALIDRKRILVDFLTRDYPCTVPTGIMFRAEALRGAGKVPPEAKFAGDLALSMRIATKWDFYYIDEVLSSFRYVDTSHTAVMHQTGVPDSHAWYFVTRETLDSPAVREIFGGGWNKTKRDAYFFCTCRAASLNAIALAKSRNPKIVLMTLKTLIKEDPYITNFLRLPGFVFSQIWVSLFPPKWPPPRE